MTLTEICRRTLENSPFRNGKTITDTDVLLFVRDIERLMEESK